MVDTDKLKRAVQHFVFSSGPTSANDSTPCTVGDVNLVIKNISKVLNTFIDELENQ